MTSSRIGAVFLAQLVGESLDAVSGGLKLGERWVGWEAVDVDYRWRRYVRKQGCDRSCFALARCHTQRRSTLQLSSTTNVHWIEDLLSLSCWLPHTQTVDPPDTTALSINTECYGK
ncbi:hypothetical protein BDY19DRAFT_1044214 [Irpex rosettiformis]|uniref:Uncharacterized protein n=1 Tax=Irpex rosettiformis TaxID=378272 RepID=A0ACB8UJX0_9APHY|nr:hypothetical protein BDY19DRAFT_1044214 [Irpex rosettiformis]